MPWSGPPGPLTAPFRPRAAMVGWTVTTAQYGCHQTSGTSSGMTHIMSMALLPLPRGNILLPSLTLTAALPWNVKAVKQVSSLTTWMLRSILRVPGLSAQMSVNMAMIFGGMKQEMGVLLLPGRLIYRRRVITTFMPGGLSIPIELPMPLIPSTTTAVLKPLM